MPRAFLSEAVADLGAEDEPPLGLPAAGHNGIRVEARIRGGIGLVVDELLDQFAHLGAVAAGHAGHVDLGQIIVAHDVGVDVVRQAVAVPGLDGHVGQVAHHQGGHGLGIPVIVGVVDLVLDPVGRVAQILDVVDAGADTLLDAEVLDDLGLGQHGGVVGHEDHVVALVGIPARGSADVEVHRGQRGVVEQVLPQHGIGPAAATARIIPSGAALESDLDPVIGEDLEGAIHRIVLEGRHAQKEAVHTAHGAGIRHEHRLGREVGVHAVDGGILVVRGRRIVVLPRNGSRGQEVETLEHLVTAVQDLHLDRRTLGEGDVAGEAGQVRRAGVVAEHGAGQVHALHGLTLVGEFRELDVRDGEGDLQPLVGLIHDMEALGTPRVLEGDRFLAERRQGQEGHH